MEGPNGNTPSPLSKNVLDKNTGLLSPPDPLCSGSDTSGLQSLETEALKAHGSQQLGEYRVKRSVESFVKDLLEFVAGGGKESCHLQSIYYKPAPEFDPCLLRDGDMIYSLLPCFTTMIPDKIDDDKDGEMGSIFCRFDFDAKRCKESLSSTLKSDYFLPLGCLVEKNIKTGEICSTNYVPCLKVTNEPISLWLVYDYSAVREDEDEDEEIPFGGIYDFEDYDSRFHVPDQLDRPSSADQTNKTPAFPGGLFLSFEQFDVAELSEDICRDWIGHAMEGLNPFKVHDCMRRTLRTYGGTLRPVETWPKRVGKEASI